VSGGLTDTAEAAARAMEGCLAHVVIKEVAYAAEVLAKHIPARLTCTCHSLRVVARAASSVRVSRALSQGSFAISKALCRALFYH